MCFGINKLLLDFSTTSTAVFGAYFKLQTFVYMAIFGLDNALIPIVAFNLGAKHADRIKKVIRLSGISSLIISALRQVIILLPLASVLGKRIGINGIWWSFLISETVTVIAAILYLGFAEKKELIICDGRNIEDKK